MLKNRFNLGLMVILIGIISCNSNSQSKIKKEGKERDLTPIVELFDKSGNKIDEKLLVKYFEINNTKLKSNEFKTVKKVDFKNDITGFIYKIDCRAGAQCEIINMVLFKSGEKTDEMRIGQNFSDYGGSKILENNIKGNRIELTKTILENEWSENGDLKEIKNTEKEIFTVNINSGRFEKE